MNFLKKTEKVLQWQEKEAYIKISNSSGAKNEATRLIVCTAVSKGKEHDFKIFKITKVKINKNIKCLADKEVQETIKVHNKDSISS